MSIILQIWDNFHVISERGLTKENQTLEGYIKIPGPQPHHPSVPKDNSKFKSYLYKYLV